MGVGVDGGVVRLECLLGAVLVFQHDAQIEARGGHAVGPFQGGAIVVFRGFEVASFVHQAAEVEMRASACC